MTVRGGPRITPLDRRVLPRFPVGMEFRPTLELRQVGGRFACCLAPWPTEKGPPCRRPPTAISGSGCSASRPRRCPPSQACTPGSARDERPAARKWPAPPAAGGGEQHGRVIGTTVRGNQGRLSCHRRRRGPQVRQGRGQADQSIARSAPHGADALLPRGARAAAHGDREVAASWAARSRRGAARYRRGMGSLTAVRPGAPPWGGQPAAKVLVRLV
jgi:hypothetical protein